MVVICSVFVILSYIYIFGCFTGFCAELRGVCGGACLNAVAFSLLTFLQVSILFKVTM